MSNYWLIGILVYWYVADCFCFAVNSYAYEFTGFGKTMKASLFSFFFCPIVIISSVSKKKIRISKRGVKMSIFYPVSLTIFLSLYSLQRVLNLLSELFDVLGEKSYRVYEKFISFSGRFLNE